MEAAPTASDDEADAATSRSTAAGAAASAGASAVPATSAPPSQHHQLEPPLTPLTLPKQSPAGASPPRSPSSSAPRLPAVVAARTPPSPTNTRAQLQPPASSPVARQLFPSQQQPPSQQPTPKASAFAELWGQSVTELDDGTDDYVPPYPLKPLPARDARPAKSIVKRNTVLPNGHVRFALPEGTRARAEAVANNEGAVVPAGTGFPSYSYAALELYQYYQTLCQRKGMQPWDKLLAQIKAASNGGQRLTTLDLRGLTFTRRGAEVFGDLLINTTRLRQLNLEHTQLDDDMLKAVLEGALFHNRVEWLNLAHNRKLRLSGIRYVADYISKNPCLTYLDLSGVVLDKRMAQILAQGLNTVRCAVETLRLQECGIKHPVFESLARGLKTSRVASLSFRHNGLPPLVAPVLYELLMYNQHLKRLDLRNNDIKSAGATALSQALVRNNVLESLILWENNIGTDGLEALAEALRFNSSLMVLDISYNPVGDAGAIALLRNSLFSNKKLEWLGLAGTGTNVEGAIAMAEVLPETRTLRSLNLSSNRLELAGLMALSVSMKLNRSVTSLDVSSETNSPDEKRLMDDIANICDANARLLGEQKQARGSVDSASETHQPSHSRSRTTTQALTVQTPVSADATPSLLDRLREADDRASLLDDVLRNLSSESADSTPSPEELELIQELNAQCSKCLRDFGNWTIAIGDPTVKASLSKVIAHLTQVTVVYETVVGALRKTPRHLQPNARLPAAVVVTSRIHSTDSDTIDLDDFDADRSAAKPPASPAIAAPSARRRSRLLQDEPEEDVATSTSASFNELSLESPTTSAILASLHPPEVASEVPHGMGRERADSSLPQLILASASQHPHRGSPPPLASAIVDASTSPPIEDDDVVV